MFETVKKVKKSKFSKHHQMSPNVIKHRKTIQTSVLMANLASNCLPEPVWVVVTKTGTFLRQNWDISAPKLGHFCPFGRFTSFRRLTGAKILDLRRSATFVCHKLLLGCRELKSSFLLRLTLRNCPNRQLF